MPQDPVRMKAGMGAAMPVNPAERPPLGIEEQIGVEEQKKPKAERAESLLESVEKDLEQRFIELKRRLQELDATLVGSDNIINSMKKDLADAEALGEGEEWSEEKLQFEEYTTEIAVAKTEQARLREKLKILVSVADEGELNKAFASHQLDELSLERDAAEKEGNEKKVAHIEAEMLGKMEAMGIETPEQRAQEAATAEQAAMPEAVQDRTPEAKLTERASQFGALQQAEARALQASAGVVTPEVQKIRGEMLQTALAQLEDLRSQLTASGGANGWQELVDGWSQVVTRLQGVPSEQPAPTPAVQAERAKEHPTEAIQSAEPLVAKAAEGTSEGPLDSSGKTGLEQAQTDAENVVLEAHADQPGAEIVATPELQDRQAEFANESRFERQNIYERLMLKQKWSQEAAGGAVTDETRAIHEELRALAPLIRKDIESAAYAPKEKASLLADWDKKIEALAKDPVAIDIGTDGGRSRFMEEWGYSMSLARSARAEIDASQGKVNEKAKGLLREAIAIDTKQLKQLEAGEASAFEPETRMKELRASLKELKGLLGEKPEAEDGEKGYQGINSAEGMPTILKGTVDLIDDFERSSMQRGFSELNELLDRQRTYGPLMEEMASSMKGVLRLADDISEQVAMAQRKFEEEELSQEDFDQLVKEVGEQLSVLKRRAEGLADEFANTSSSLGVYLENHGNELGSGVEDDVRHHLSNQLGYLQNLAESIAKKKASWQELEDHRD